MLSILDSEEITSIFLRILPEIDFPFELCKFGPKSSRKFIGDELDITRWYLGGRAAANRGVQNITSIAKVHGNLKLGFSSESNAISEAFSELPLTESSVLTRDDFIGKVLRTTNHDLIHYKGHISSVETAEHILSFENGTQFRLAELGAIYEETEVFKRNPVVVLNGCSSSSSSSLIGGADSFPHRLTNLDISAFVGTYWKIDERAGTHFTRALYQALLDNTLLSEAVRRARMALLDLAFSDSEKALSAKEKIACYVASRAYVYFGPSDLSVTFEGD
ncbi:MAG: CHAT domain-containing protein [Paracoccaceae bacterium]